MKAVKEFREERDDVYSFWENVPTIENGKIVQINTKIEEATILELEKRITDAEKQIVDATAKIELDKSKF